MTGAQRIGFEIKLVGDVVDPNDVRRRRHTYVRALRACVLPQKRTTIMMRNIPNKYTEAMLVRRLCPLVSVVAWTDAPRAAV